MKTIDIAIPTFPAHLGRLEALLTTTRLLRERLSASRHALKFYISSEDADDKSLNRLCEWVLRYMEDQYGVQWTVRIGQPRDLGANMNSAMQMGKGDYCLMVQDDMALNAPLDLSDYCDALDDIPSAALIRFGWAHTQFRQEIGKVQEIDKSAPWPFADEPWMQRGDRKWLYAEGLHHGGQESELSARLLASGVTLCASHVPYFHHGWALSSIESRRRAEMEQKGIPATA